MFWVSYEFLHVQFVNFIFILCAIGFIDYRKVRTNVHKKFDTRKILYAISIGQITTFGLSTLYICHSLDWQFRPHATQLIKFIGSSSNLILLIIFFYFGMFLTLSLSQFSCSLSLKDWGLHKSQLSFSQMFRLIFCACIVIASIRGLFYFIDPTFINNQVEVNFIETISPSLSLVLFVIVAPFVEELFYRGLIYNALRENIKLEYSIIVQASLFAMSHASLNNFVIHFINGLIYGYIYFKTDSLFSSIFLHFVLNGFLVVIISIS